MSFFQFDDPRYSDSNTDSLLKAQFGPGMYGVGKGLGIWGKEKPLPTYEDPRYPSYVQSFDPYSMSTQPFAASLTGNIMPDKRGIEAYRGEALRTGPSAWAGLARNKSMIDEARARESMGAQAASQSAAARSDIARRGGLSGGAAERLAMNANRNALMAGQGVAAEGMSNRAGILAQDEGNRLKLLAGLPSAEVEHLRPQQWIAEQNIRARQGDINNTIAENQARNLYNMQLYQELMQANQANRNADVIAATAPKDQGLLGNIFGGLF